MSYLIPLWLTLLPVDKISRISQKYNVPFALVASIVSVESNGEKCATRYEYHYRYLYKAEQYAKQLRLHIDTERMHQQTSWGLMQIMGGVARESGFSGHLVELCNPILNLDIGVKFLKGLIDKYNNIPDAISAYNAGSPRKNELGDYLNQDYVDRVIEKYNQIKEES